MFKTSSSIIFTSFLSRRTFLIPSFSSLPLSKTSTSTSHSTFNLSPGPTFIRSMTIQVPLYSAISNPSSQSSLPLSTTSDSNSLDDFLTSTSKPSNPLTLQVPDNVKPFNSKPDNKAMLEKVARDFRTDTITVPTEEMIAAMADASRGDDVYEVSH